MKRKNHSISLRHVGAAVIVQVARCLHNSIVPRLYGHQKLVRRRDVFITWTVPYLPTIDVK